MTTTSDELQYTNITRIAGQDEQYAADVIIRNDGKKAIVTDAQVNITNNIPPALNSKYRVEWSDTVVNFPASSNYSTFYLYNGSGYLHGFHIDTNSDKCQVKLTVDGEVIYSDITGKFLSDISFKSTGSNNPIMLQNRSGLTTEGNNDIDFSPHADLRFNSSIKIELKKSDNTAFTTNRYLVFITKE